jgi:3-hydroxybutyryl-CoA dehydrogenase
VAFRDITQMASETFKRIGIVGSGRMGDSIFYHLNDFEYSLVWIFRKPDLRDKAIQKLQKKMRRMLKAGAFDEQAYNHKIENTLITSDISELNSCDLIIETVVEDIAIKSELFEELDRNVKKECVFVSNSSSIKPAKICPDSVRREKFAGFHFFFPVRFNETLEIMGTDSCSSQTIDSLKKFAEEIGKKPLVLPEKGSFILNKVFIYTQAQAFWAYRDNILTVKEIDDLIRKHIFTMGTFEFLDHVGLDVILAAAKIYLEDMEHKEFINITIEEVQQVVDKGNLGVKTGKGFYSYNKDEKEEPFNLRQIGEEERKKYEEDLVDKLICLYMNCAYDFIDKGYCTEPEIEFALSEYKGMEKGPVTLGQEVGFKKVLDSLMRFSKETGEKVFYPSASLKIRAEQGKE